MPTDLSHVKEGRKEILLMHATTKVDEHVNVLSNESMGLSSIEASYDVLADKGLIISPHKPSHDA